MAAPPLIEVAPLRTLNTDIVHVEFVAQLVNLIDEWLQTDRVLQFEYKNSVEVGCDEDCDAVGSSSRGRYSLVFDAIASGCCGLSDPDVTDGRV